MFFEGPKLKHAFSGGGGKPPQPEEPAGLFDKFKAAAVSFQGPVVCQKLKIAVDDLMARHTVEGRAKDVRTHFALQAVIKRAEGFRDTIQQGGAEGYAKMKEATHYLARLQKLGLDA